MLRSSEPVMVSAVVRGRAAMSLAIGLLAVLAAFLVLFSVGAKPAQAVTTFTVNSTGDENDLDFFGTSDGKCDVDSGTTGDQCTLRAAIQEANVTANSGGPDEIKFNIPGAGPHTILLDNSMTPITEAVTIDGYTQGENTTGTTTDDAEENTIPLATNGTNAVLKIVLDAGAVDTGLDINASNVLVRGLAIHSSTVWGIIARSTATNLRIEGNFIGTDAGGISDKGNGGPGIEIQSAANFTVGGETPAARNLISGSGTGIFARDSNVSGAQVEGNLIGTAKNGTSPLPNESSGVAFENVGSGNSVGGVTAESANTIAFNGDAGVVISGDNARVSVLRNSIFSNGSEGIRLNLTFPLDNLDADTGPNGGQNVPLINTAKTSRKATTIAGTLHSKPNQIYTLRFFSNPPEGSDPQFAQYEGRTFEAQREPVITDGSGNASFSFKLKGTEKIPKGQFVTATVTASNGDTSMFSPGKRVVRQR
jgi:hypothetical protein